MRTPLEPRVLRLASAALVGLLALALLWGIPRWRMVPEARSGTVPTTTAQPVAASSPAATATYAATTYAAASYAPASAAASSAGSRPPAAARPAAAASVAPAAPAASTAPATGAQPVNLAIPDDTRKIIKNGSLVLIVKDVDSAVVQASGFAVLNGGDVAQSTNNKTDDTRTADMVLVVPSENFEKLMDSLRKIEGVVDRKVDKTESKDVTEEFVDIQAQILNLEATERQVRALMEQATRMEDILLLQRETANLRGQIERLQGRSNWIERRAATSTITLRLEPPPPPSPSPSPSPEPVVEVPPPPPWSFTGVVGDAWERSLEGLQRVITVVATGLTLGWWFIVPVLIALFWWWLLRRRSRRARVPGDPPPAASVEAVPGD